LVTALGAKANLVGGNSFTGAQTVTGTVIGSQVLRVLGASGQTANLQQWENGGVVQASVTAFGGATFATGGTVYGRLSVNAGTATTVGAVIRGAASQSANLQEWQNSAGSILGKFDSAGQMWAASLYTNNFWARMGENNSGGQITLIRSTAAGTGTANGLRFQVLAGTNANTYKFVAIGPSNTVTTILDNIPQ
jgi:hypothetical protein